MTCNEFLAALASRNPALLDGLTPTTSPRLALRHIARKAGFRPIRSWESTAVLLDELWHWIEATQG